MIDTTLAAMSEAQHVGREAAIAEVKRLDGRFDLCGRAELRQSAMFVTISSSSSIHQLFARGSCGYAATHKQFRLCCAKSHLC